MIVLCFEKKKENIIYSIALQRNLIKKHDGYFCYYGVYSKNTDLEKSELFFFNFKNRFKVF